MILDAVERLMHRGGHAAISTRRVAAEAGLKAPLAHYYYPTLDDLLIAFYRRAGEKMRRHSADVQASRHPLRSLWELNIDPQRGALGAEFLALAKHRESIRAEIAREVEAVRNAQAAVFKSLLRNSRLAREIGSPEGAAFLLAACARALQAEGQIGISKGHADAKRFIEACIKTLESDASPSPQRKLTRRRIDAVTPWE